MKDTPQQCSEQPKDTPRTNAWTWDQEGPDSPMEAFEKFAQKLERELHYAGHVIQGLRDKLQRVQITNKVLLGLCEEVQTLVLKSPNEALIRRWFADLRAAQKDMERG